MDLNDVPVARHAHHSPSGLEHCSSSVITLHVDNPNSLYMCRGEPKSHLRLVGRWYHPSETSQHFYFSVL